MAEVFAWIEGHPGLASYIQMIGSLATLALAVWLPHRQRHALERATALQLRGGLRLAAYSVHSASYLFPSPQDYEPPVEPPEPSTVAKDLARACSRLQGISLQHLRHDHAELLQGLQERMEQASDQFRAWMEGENHDFDSEGHEQNVYFQILQIYEAMPTTKDADLAWTLSGALAQIEEDRAERMASLKRANVRSPVAAKRSLFERLTTLMTKKAAWSTSS
jgi:hypothetical protein